MLQEHSGKGQWMNVVQLRTRDICLAKIEMCLYSLGPPGASRPRPIASTCRRCDDTRRRWRGVTAHSWPWRHLLLQAAQKACLDVRNHSGGPKLQRGRPLEGERARRRKRGLCLSILSHVEGWWVSKKSEEILRGCLRAASVEASRDTGRTGERPCRKNVTTC